MKKGHPCNCQCESGCEPVITVRSFGLASGDFLWEHASVSMVGLSPDNKIWVMKTYQSNQANYDYKIPVSINTYTHTYSFFSFLGGSFGGQNYNRFIDKNNTQHQFINQQNTDLYYNIDLGYIDNTGQFHITCSGYHHNRCAYPFNESIGKEYEKGCLYLQGNTGINNSNIFYRVNNSGLAYTSNYFLKPIMEIENGYELSHSGRYIINPFCLIPTSGQPTINARWKISSSGNRWTNTIGPTVTFPLYANTGEVVSALSTLPSISGITASGGPLGRKPMTLDITWTTSSGNFDFVAIEGVEKKIPFVDLNTGYVDAYDLGFTSFCTSDASGIISVTSASTSLSVPRGDICRVDKLKFRGISSHPYLYVDYNYTWRTQLWGGLTRTVSLRTINGPYGPYQDSVPISNGMSDIKNGKLVFCTNRRRSPSGSTWYDVAILNESSGEILYNGHNNAGGEIFPSAKISNDGKIVSWNHYRFNGDIFKPFNVNGQFILYKPNFSDYFNNSDDAILINTHGIYYDYTDYSLLSNNGELLVGGQPANSAPLETGYLSSGTFYGVTYGFDDGIYTVEGTAAFSNWTRQAHIQVYDKSFLAYNADFEWRIHLVDNFRNIYFSTNWMSFGVSPATIQSEVDAWYGSPDGVNKAIIVNTTLNDNDSKSMPSFIREPSIGWFITLRQNGIPPYAFVPLNRSIAISYRNKIIFGSKALINYDLGTDSFKWRREVGILPLQYGYSLTNKYSGGGPIYCDTNQVVTSCVARSGLIPSGIIFG